LELALHHNNDAVALMQRLSFANAVVGLRAVLPTQLRSFTILMDPPSPTFEAPSARTSLLLSSLFSALSAMPQLTELDVAHQRVPLPVRCNVLSQLPYLRKLSLYLVEWTDERLAALKQISQLRDLDSNLESDTLIKLGQPPHSLQLERIHMATIRVKEPVMRGLLHLPTLTELEPQSLLPAAWPLLPQLPMLRRLCVHYGDGLTGANTTLLATALSGCRALTELSLGIVFEDDDGEDATNEQQQARWSEILRSVPQLHSASRFGHYKLFPYSPCYLRICRNCCI
jgi:hypothetical protein